MSKTLVVVSGKGGTGKTMFAANIGCMLAKLGCSVCLIDMNSGIRSLDLYLGMEDNVVFNVNDVLSGVCRIKKALIKNKEYPGLYFISSSLEKFDNEITPLHVNVMCRKLEERFDFVIVDAPSGVNDGLALALGGAGDVVVVLNPEIASIRDCSSILGAIDEFGRGVKTDGRPSTQKTDIHYIINRVNYRLIKDGFAIAMEQLPGYIRKNVIGIIEEDENIHISTNIGTPVIKMGEKNPIYQNMKSIAQRIIDIYR